MYFVSKITHLRRYEELTKTTLIINLFAWIKKLFIYPIMPTIIKN
jgi:hypothetical protein